MRASAAISTASTSLPAVSPSAAIRRPLSDAGTAGSDSIGAIVGERLRAAGGNREQAAGAVGTALVARRGVTKIAQHELRVAVGLRAQRTGLVPLRHDRKRRGGRRRIVEQLLQGLRRRGVQWRSRPPSIRATARTMLALSAHRGGSGPGGRNQQLPGMVGQRRGQRRPRRSRSTPADGRSVRASAT